MNRNYSVYKSGSPLVNCSLESLPTPTFPSSNPTFLENSTLKRVFVGQLVEYIFMSYNFLSPIQPFLKENIQAICHCHEAHTRSWLVY